MAKQQVTVNEEEQGILYEAIQDRINELDKIAGSLLRKKLPDAAKDVYNEIKRLRNMQSKFATTPEPKPKVKTKPEPAAK